MSVTCSALRVLCPMHALLDESGCVVQAGPTLQKLCSEIEGAQFLEKVEVYRPRGVTNMDQLLSSAGRKLYLRLRTPDRTQLKGHLVRGEDGGAVLDLSFGIGVVDAVRDFALSRTDFSPTDLAIELLYLVEAKTAAMDSSRQLNTRLQGAMLDAEERAFTDTLTGLRNRRALDHVLAKLTRGKEAYALMQVDLDFFKQVNDTLGHAAGDRVLQVVARILMDETRKTDVVARIGGDEFVVVFTEAMTEERLEGLASRLISRIERPIPFDEHECRVSASIGINRSAIYHDAQRALEAADAALYTAKRAGRAQFAFDATLAAGAKPEPLHIRAGK